MKKLFIMIMLASGALVSCARAESGFNYQFNFEYGDGAISNVSYSIITGDPSTESGDWTVAINNPRGEKLVDYNFDPSVSNIFVVPAENNGTEAIFTSPQGIQMARVWLAGSRVCDDNGACEEDSGEDEQNCPADCSVVETASIAQSGTAVAGRWIFRVGLAFAGAFLLIVVARSLDSRRRI